MVRFRDFLERLSCLLPDIKERPCRMKCFLSTLLHLLCSTFLLLQLLSNTLHPNNFPTKVECLDLRENCYKTVVYQWLHTVTCVCVSVCVRAHTHACRYVCTYMNVHVEGWVTFGCVPKKHLTFLLFIVLFYLSQGSLVESGAYELGWAEWPMRCRTCWFQPYWHWDYMSVSPA